MISYPALLELFWASHKPERGSHSRQYMAAVFAHGRVQLEDALASRATITAKGILVETPVISGARFYLAEDYHQKYHLRQDPVLMAELARYNPYVFVNSTVAARLNGYVAGHGTPEQLAAELDDFGLSRAAADHLVARVGRRGH